MTTTKKARGTSEYTTRETAYRAHIAPVILSRFYADYAVALRWVEGALAFHAGRGEPVPDNPMSEVEVMIFHLFARAVSGLRPRDRKRMPIVVFPPVLVDSTDEGGNKTRVFRDLRALPKKDVAAAIGKSEKQVTAALKKLRSRSRFAGLREIDVFFCSAGVSLDCGKKNEQLCLFDFEGYKELRDYAHKQRVAIGQALTGQMEVANKRRAELAGVEKKPDTKRHLVAAPNNDAVPTTGTGGE